MRTCCIVQETILHIYGEKESKKENIYIYISMCVYIYIYVYIHKFKTESFCCTPDIWNAKSSGP